MITLHQNSTPYDIGIREMAMFDTKATAISNLREACINIYNEVSRSDAKSPKARLYAYIGKFEFKKSSLIDLMEEE